MTICMETLFNKRIEKLYKLIISKIGKQIYKFKSYLWRRKLEKVFKETKEAAELCCNLERARIGSLPKYFGNTPDFLTCLEKDSFKTFSNKAFLDWEKRKVGEIGIPEFPPVSRYEGV